MEGEADLDVCEDKAQIILQHQRFKTWDVQFTACTMLFGDKGDGEFMEAAHVSHKIQSSHGETQEEARSNCNLFPRESGT